MTRKANSVAIEISQESWMIPFIEALTITGHVQKSCELADISRNTVYRYRRDNETFRTQWDIALRDAGWSLQDEAIRRSRDGVDEPIVWQGAIVGIVKKYSDTLLIFMLKNIMPDVYGDKLTIKFTQEQLGILKSIGATPDEAFNAFIAAAHEAYQAQLSEASADGS